MLNADQRFREALDRAYVTACDALLAERTSEGCWVGELSSSALATATAVSALSLVRESVQNSGDFKSQISNLIANGLGWLTEHQNADGGWGDTTLSLSNISTTMLVRAAFQLAGAMDNSTAILARASVYIDQQGGATAMVARYGEDRTFAVPILANCALAGQADWGEVASLPFELACLPHSWFRFLRLHVVSYALPALIAIGQLIHVKRPSWNLLARLLRRLAVRPTLRKLEAIQPESGGFLEAIPLTSFVVMSLVAAGRHEHPVVQKSVEFLLRTARPDGSWPIDSNLSVWLTTLAINALVAAPDGLARLPIDEQCRTRDWLLRQQLRDVHPYTNAAPGGWGWSHLSGSVPDADDTAGAVLALSYLPRSDESTAAAERGIRWLLDLQNRDGGWPTFCRGWGHLPFDRSGADLTAHALRAFFRWQRSSDDVQAKFLTHNMSTYDVMQALSPSWLDRSIGRMLKLFLNRSPVVSEVELSIIRGLLYLQNVQRPDGSSVPLWFGSQFHPNDENPVYGTSKVLCAYAALGMCDSPTAQKSVEWLVQYQSPEGGWGGARNSPPSVEETALAIDALTSVTRKRRHVAVRRGVQWLIDRVESGDWRKPSPIGLYFAKLWYFEKLYPMMLTVAALGRARRALSC